MDLMGCNCVNKEMSATWNLLHGGYNQTLWTKEICQCFHDII